MFMRSLYLEYVVAFCRNTVRNVALGFRMVGHHCARESAAKGQIKTPRLSKEFESVNKLFLSA